MKKKVILIDFESGIQYNPYKMNNSNIFVLDSWESAVQMFADIDELIIINDYFNKKSLNVISRDLVEMYRILYGFRITHISKYNNFLKGSKRHLCDLQYIDPEILFELTASEDNGMLLDNLDMKVSEITAYEILDEFDISYIMNNIPKLQLLASDYLSIEIGEKNCKKDLASLQDNFASVKAESEILLEANEILRKKVRQNTKSYNELILKYQKAAYNLQKYDDDQADMNLFSKAPGVIYLKESFPILDEFSYYKALKDNLEMQLDLSVKVVVFPNREFSSRIELVPEYYQGINILDSKLLASNDYIIKVGESKQLLEILFENEQKYDLIVIVDKRGGSDLINGSYIKYNLCGSKNYIKDLELDSALIGGNPSEEDSYFVYKNSLEMSGIIRTVRKYKEV